MPSPRVRSNSRRTSGGRTLSGKKKSSHSGNCTKLSKHGTGRKVPPLLSKEDTESKRQQRNSIELADPSLLTFSLPRGFMNSLNSLRKRRSPQPSSVTGDSRKHNSGQSSPSASKKSAESQRRRTRSSIPKKKILRELTEALREYRDNPSVKPCGRELGSFITLTHVMSCDNCRKEALTLLLRTLHTAYGCTGRARRSAAPSWRRARAPCIRTIPKKSWTCWTRPSFTRLGYLSPTGMRMCSS